MARICGWFGVTRQAYYQHTWRALDTSIEAHLVVKEILEIRKDHKKMGGRKMYEKLGQFLLDHQIKMGRDAFFDLLACEGLLVKRRKRKAYTTNSYHWLKKYPNLIEEYEPTGPNQLWVSDITYWKIYGIFLYINLVTDAYSHTIVGHSLSETLEATATTQALQMAIVNNKDRLHNLIHHSDRGVQYCSQKYTDLLIENGIKISMTQTGDPRENAIAERSNGILKEEYLSEYEAKTFEEAWKILDRSIYLINTDRPHMSISNLYPIDVHNGNHDILPEKLWKNYRKEKYKVQQNAEFSEGILDSEI